MLYLILVLGVCLFFYISIKYFLPDENKNKEWKMQAEVDKKRIFDKEERDYPVRYKYLEDRIAEFKDCVSDDISKMDKYWYEVSLNGNRAGIFCFTEYFPKEGDVFPIYFDGEIFNCKIVSYLNYVWKVERI